MTIASSITIPDEVGARGGHLKRNKALANLPTRPASAGFVLFRCFNSPRSTCYTMRGLFVPGLVSFLSCRDIEAPDYVWGGPQKSNACSHLTAPTGATNTKWRPKPHNLLRKRRAYVGPLNDIHRLVEALSLRSSS